MEETINRREKYNTDLYKVEQMREIKTQKKESKRQKT